MVRHERLMVMLLPIALVGVNIFASEAFAQKVMKETAIFVPVSLSLTADSAMVTACPAQANKTASVVHLNARATSPGGYPIRYQWRTNGGRIEGDGATVTWDLSGLQPGYYRAFVDIDTGNGDELCQAFSSTSVLVNRCPPPAPVCPTVAISCPDKPVVGDTLDFTAAVTGGSPNVAPIYNWTVSAGTIIAGQGTGSIKVATAGLAGQSVRAMLSMDGYQMDCSATCMIQFPVPLECRKFDEFPDVARNDEKARLDNYAIELQNDPTSIAYVIVYPGQRARPGQVQKRTTRIVDYMINSRDVDARRIMTKVGPPRSDLLVELWSCPQGAKAPTSVP